MKKIQLTKGMVAIVDDEDCEYLNQWKWYFGSSGYAESRSARPNRKHISMHRLIAKTPPGMETDHINGNKLDNRRGNLRICTHSQNDANGFTGVVGKGGYKGVYPNKKMWKATITVKHKTIYLGLFDNKLDAALAYDIAARKYFGEFAKLNFPDYTRGIPESMIMRANGQAELF